MTKLILFNKPFDVLSQFSKDGDQRTLAGYIDIKNVYPAGRLDKTSEGLLLLTDDGNLQHKISHPDHKMKKTYWVQVDGVPTTQAINQLTSGVELKDGLTKKAQASIIKQPNVWQRDPPVRYRANIPTTWLSLTISEGKNRQIRRMTAAVGFPTLRLIRYAIGPWNINNIQPGQWQIVEVSKNI
ncbi:Ribosomal large subunit pseudouridine synthase E [hydrothermal vent metagenome]|uniref:Ribosomal large subunit pseudouridine synthase E n=1 Tax=hydrothermal vent metagenome TaxID=652676 RepID=A0A3B1ABV0_9ZZZZ